MKDDCQSTSTAPDLANPVVGFRQWRLADGRLDVPVVPHRDLTAVRGYGLPVDPAMRPPRCWEVSGGGHLGIVPTVTTSLAGAVALRARAGTRRRRSG